MPQMLSSAVHQLFSDLSVDDLNALNCIYGWVCVDYNILLKGLYDENITIGIMIHDISYASLITPTQTIIKEKKSG